MGKKDIRHSTRVEPRTHKGKPCFYVFCVCGYQSEPLDTMKEADSDENEHMINREVVRKWVEALRSGEYEQGRMYLKDGNYYCCLGVLCDLYYRETGKGTWRGGDFVLGGVNRTHPPIDVWDWAGISPDGGPTSLCPIIEGTFLTDRNDRGESFSEIADLIEKEYL